MLALIDERTGSRAEVRPGRDGLLRIAAHIQAEPLGGSDVTALRVLLLADLVARVAELRGAQALTAVVFPGSVPDSLTDFERAADALGIHPPGARISLPDAGASLGGALDVLATADDAGNYGAAGARTSSIGDRGIVMHCGALHLDSDALRMSDPDMLAIRLALLSVPYGDDVSLDRPALTAAAEELTNSRRLVAGWAESPSKPMPANVASRLQAAFDELDTTLAIGVLREMADDAGPAPGAKFESFAFADRILGLDLAREIGRFTA